MKYLWFWLYFFSVHVYIILFSCHAIVGCCFCVFGLASGFTSNKFMFVAYFYLPCVLNRPSTGSKRTFSPRGHSMVIIIMTVTVMIGTAMMRIRRRRRRDLRWTIVATHRPLFGRKSSRNKKKLRRTHSLMSLMPGTIDILLKGLHRTGVAHN